MCYTRQEWFKTTAEMNALFADVPQALESTQEIAAKVEEFDLNSDPIMPEFPIPEDFATWAGYLEKFKEEDLKAEFGAERDRKSTRLNSSHVRISYAVFCLKKKKKIKSSSL